jgi:hypothetical protein
MREHCCGASKAGKDFKTVNAAVSRSLEGIMTVSEEIGETLAKVKTCPTPCEDGMMLVTPSSGSPRRVPCPILNRGCEYGRRMKKDLERYFIRVMTKAGVPFRHIDNFRGHIDSLAVSEANGWPMLGFLIFCGGSGSGKSFGAAWVVKAYLRDRISDWRERSAWERAEMAGENTMWCGAMEIGDDRDVAARTRGKYLLIIDDLGMEKESGQSAVCGVISKRYDLKLPTVITTGLTMPDIRDRYGPHIVERLVEDAGCGGKIIDCGDVSIRRMREKLKQS